jgi:hypothetical protein
MAATSGPMAVLGAEQSGQAFWGVGLRQEHALALSGGRPGDRGGHGGSAHAALASEDEKSSVEQAFHAGHTIRSRKAVKALASNIDTRVYNASMSRKRAMSESSTTSDSNLGQSVTRDSTAKIVLRRGRARPLWFGHPWVYANAIDRVEGTGRPRMRGVAARPRRAVHRPRHLQFALADSGAPAFACPMSRSTQRSSCGGCARPMPCGRRSLFPALRPRPIAG